MLLSVRARFVRIASPKLIRRQTSVAPATVRCHTPISRTSPTARASSARIEPVSQNRRKALFKSRFTTDSHDRGVSLEESIHLLIPVLVLPFPLPLLPLLHKLRLPLLHKLRPIVRL